jgi:hypothetical protein
MFSKGKIEIWQRLHKEEKSFNHFQNGGDAQDNEAGGGCFASSSNKWLLLSTVVDKWHVHFSRQTFSNKSVPQNVR